MKLGYQLPKYTGTKRPCMRCKRAFRSQGDHNRMCGDCREYADQVSPFLCEGWGTVSDARHAYKEALVC